MAAQRRVALLAGCVLFAGCTSMPLGPRASPPPPPQSESAEERRDEAPAAARPRSSATAASQSLLAQSRAQRADGKYADAATSLERALRIDPNNAALWIELGELHLQTGDASQAATMARKALTLVADDRRIEAQAERLLRAASTR